MKSVKLLTNREYEVFRLLQENFSSNKISEILNISEKTVRNHISNVMQKLGAKTRSEALEVLVKSNILKR